MNILAAWSFENSGMLVLNSLIFTIIGIFALVFGYLVFDKICPLDFNKELGEKNMAVAVVVSAFLIGVAMIVARVVGG